MFRLVAVPPSLLARPLHRSCTQPARKSFPPRLTVAHRSHDVRHQNGPFWPSTPPPSLLATLPHMTCIFSMSINVHIFMVNFHPPPHGTPQSAPNVGKCGGVLPLLRRCRQRSSFVLRPSSLHSAHGPDCARRWRNPGTTPAEPCHRPYPASDRTKETIWLPRPWTTSPLIPFVFSR
jgi:hypothetical protein